MNEIHKQVVLRVYFDKLTEGMRSGVHCSICSIDRPVAVLWVNSASEARFRRESKRAAGTLA